MSAPRKLVAILAADIAGYSRLTGLDEEGTHAHSRSICAYLSNGALNVADVGEAQRLLLRERGVI